MRFHSLPVALAKGHVLAHNVSDTAGRRVLRKGIIVGAGEVDSLRAAGRKTVHVVELEAGDVVEDEAAARLARALAGDGVESLPGRTGRVNLRAREAGVVRIDLDRLDVLNGVYGVALATVRENTAVRRRGVIASLKIVPYAIPEVALQETLTVASDPSALLSISKLERRRVGLVLSGSPGARPRLLPSFLEAVTERVEALGSIIDRTCYVICERAEEEEAELARVIEKAVEGVDLLLLAGETAIVDRDDIAPRAMARAGAELEVYGAPVDPGNLVAVAYRGEIPIVGMPGCARSAKPNVVDLLLPRLLVGDRMTANDLARLGHGGLLEDVPERGLPRSWID